MTRDRSTFRIPVLLLSLPLGLPALPVDAVRAPAQEPAQEIPSPEAFFGFRMGADRHLARWNELVDYYRTLDGLSDRLQVVDMGPSTLGEPFLVLFISSPENLARLDELQRMNALLADPRGASEAEIERAVAEGKAVVVQSFGLHSSEVAATQTAAELTYDMLSRTDEEMTRILDNVIAIMIPSFNPDGTNMIADWYAETVGTPYEGSRMPYLYHHYIGHDNNRDAFMQNTVESRYGAKILFRDWIPQAYVDHHQMGSYGARMYVPPYAEPIRPKADPLVWREMSWYGAHIAYKEETAGKAGIVNAAVYSGWGHFGFHWITPFHNIAGMLTESASARLATPLFLHPEQLRGGTRGLPEYEAQTTFPHPWPGGWWRVRDIVEQQKIAALATLDMAARNRSTVLKNMVLKAQRQTARGAAGDVVAYIIPAEQHDPLTAAKLVNKLLAQGIDVQRSASGFTHERRVYGAGTYVVSMVQPKMGVIRWLLGRTFYPDNSYTRDREGNPIRPYDMSTDNLAEFMGVRVDPAGEPVQAPLARVEGAIEPVGQVALGSFGYRLDGRLNDSFEAVNLLFDHDVGVRRVTRPANGLRPGDFLVAANAPDDVVSEIARSTGVDFEALDTDPAATSQPVTRQRIALYQHYYGGNIDEGWTRWLLEDFSFPYTTLMADELKEGELSEKYDVVILPADDLEDMVGETDDEDDEEPDYPPEYRGFMGQEGVDALEAFVRGGGTLVTFAEAGDLPIESFDLPVRNVVADLPSTEFWSPGSTLRVRVDATNPLGWGMPEDALATFLADCQVYQVAQSEHNERVERVVTFVDRDILQSGWLIGEDVIADKAAMVSVELGRGRVVLIGFRAQHRAQTHGTFKLLFNAFMGGRAEAVAAVSAAADR